MKVALTLIGLALVSAANASPPNLVQVLGPPVRAQTQPQQGPPTAQQRKDHTKEQIKVHDEQPEPALEPPHIQVAARSVPVREQLGSFFSSLAAAMSQPNPEAYSERNPWPIYPFGNSHYPSKPEAAPVPWYESIVTAVAEQLVEHEEKKEQQAHESNWSYFGQGGNGYGYGYK